VPGLKRVVLAGLGVFAFVYAAAYADLVLRARTAYFEGEKHLQWEREPALKAKFYDGWLENKRRDLQAEFEAGKLSREELDQRLELAKFERDRRVAESNFKYAYVWFQTAVELFSPPESKWVILSREKMAQAKSLWKAELDAKKIPYKDYMLE
jgi:hypothetical protein